MAGVYAEGTKVDSGASRAEIERTLERYGATSFAYMRDRERAAIAFTAHGKQIRFVLAMPDPKDRIFTHTPSTRRPRTAAAAAVEYEKAVRQRWRALALVVKAKLEAVNSGIFTFEQEFYAHIVLPGGETVYERTSAQVDEMIDTGTQIPLLQIEPRT